MMNDILALRDEPISRVPITVVDVETTGLSAEQDRVVEIALIRVVGGQVVDQFTSLVNPQRPIPPDAQAIHRITPDMVRDQPTFAHLLDAIAPFLSDGAILGHNVSFDLGFLHHELRRAGAPSPALPAIDTLRLARHHLRLSRHNLSAIARHLGLPEGGHRALADARLTLEVFYHLTRRIAPPEDGREPTLGDLLFAVPTSSAPARAFGQRTLVSAHGDFRVGQRLLLRYQSSSRFSERVVDIVEIGIERGVVLLSAFCHQSRDMRTFRADRIISWQEVDEHYPTMP